MKCSLRLLNAGMWGHKMWCCECETYPDPHLCPRTDCSGQIYPNSDGTEDDYANSIALDASSRRLYVTGTSGLSSADGTNSNIVTLKYNSSSGIQQCADVYNGSADLYDYGTSVAVYDNINPLLSGVFVAGTTNASVPASDYRCDFVILKYPLDCGLDVSSASPDEQKLNSGPKSFSLSQNYPNPFNPTTVIKYEEPAESYVSLRIYDVLGNEILAFPVKYRAAGYYSETIDASTWASGIYFYKLEARSLSSSSIIFTNSKRMLVIK